MKIILLYIAFAVALVLLTLDRFTPFYINNTFVHYLLMFFTIAGSVVIGVREFFKITHNKFIVATLLIVAMFCLSKYFFTWCGVWKTQTVLYINNEHPRNTIDYQLRGDMLAFGYKKRVIERHRLAPFADWILDADTAHIDNTKWKKVNIELNEMNIKDWQHQ